jgi:hypothetical protein
MEAESDYFAKQITCGGSHDAAVAYVDQAGAAWVREG